MEKMNVKKSGLSFFGFSVLAITLTFIFMNSTSSNLAYSGIPNDPNNTSVPELDFDDPSKAMVVKVFFNKEGEVIFESAHVSSTRAPINIGNPSILVIETFDEEGIPMEDYNSWHPLLIEEENEDGSFSTMLLESGHGRFTIPFNPDMGSLKVMDVSQNEELISVELTEPIRDFCQDNPDHPDCLEADLAINQVSVTNSPTFIFVGESSDVTIQTVMENNGPSSPLDTVFSQIVTFPSQVLVSPLQTIEEETSLSDTERTNDNTYSIQCLEPGNHTIVITSTLDAKQAAVSDPNLLNNEKVREHVVNCAIPVEIDIKPTKEPNSINTKSGGVIPVAILGSDTFNVADVDVTTLVFGPQASTPRHNLSNSLTLDDHTQDVNLDSQDDLVSHYRTNDTGIVIGDTEACLTGKTLNGITFEGCDSVNPIK